MHEDGAALTPRWSNVARDRKAEAIWRTLRHRFGTGIGAGRWLDVGCGSGGIACVLAQKADHVTGVDPEPWEAWRAAVGVHANLQLLAGEFDGASPPLPDASFDVVICNQVYEHVRDPAALVRNIHRVLKPGGLCYFAGPNLLWPIEPHVFWPIVHWLPREAAQRAMVALGSRRAAELDAYSATSWRLVSWFRQSGFIVYNGIPDRMAVTEGRGVLALLMRSFARLPAPVHRVFVPLMPSFVFLLQKPR